MTKTKVWDPAEHLDSPEATAAYLKAVLEDGDPQLVAAAIGDITRAARSRIDALEAENARLREALHQASEAVKTVHRS